MVALAGIGRGLMVMLRVIGRVVEFVVLAIVVLVGGLLFIAGR